MLKHPYRRRTSGFSLIEVLIALVILSVGLLGIAAMVSVSLKSKDGAYLQTQATSLAQAMLDRMRSNAEATGLGNYDIQLTDATPTAPSCMGGSITCVSTDIASLDIADWRNNLLNTLGPDAQGSITTSPVGSVTEVTITITWNDSRANQALGGSSANDTVTYTLRTAI